MKSKNKIWIVSEYYYPIVTSTGYYITEIAEYLAKKKENVNIICTDATYNEKDSFNFLKKETRNGVEIHRVKSGNIDKNNFFYRIIRLFYSSFLLAIKLFFNTRKNDQVLIVTNPAFLVLLMPFVKLFKGINYTILVHDIFPENLVAIEKMKNTSFFYKLLKLAYDYSYSKADRCIAIGRDMSEVLKSKIKNKSEIIIIPNWSDVEDVFPLNKIETKLINKYELKNKFVFQFAGNLGHAQGLDNIIEAIKLIKNENIHFLFIGSGAMENRIKDFIESNTLKNVTQIGFQNRIEQNDFLNACDVAIVTLSDGMYGLGVPSKSYNIMASGKPLLAVAHEKSEISLCISENRIGWIVEPNNPLLLSSFFQNIYNEKIENDFSNVMSSREVAINIYSKQIILERFASLFN